MSPYATVYVFVLAAAAFAAAMLVAARLLRPSLAYARKRSTYECGIPATGGTEVKLNIRFYVFALLFVVFDVETLYVLPWAATARELGPAALAEMGVFLSVLFLGLVYAWAKGALQWE